MKNRVTMILLSLLTCVAGCSSNPKQTSLNANSSPNANGSFDAEAVKSWLKSSSVDIQYVLGRDHYRFFALAEGNSITGNTFLNRQVLDAGPIDGDRYPDFFKKASDFVDQTIRNPAQSLPCRSPFTVTVKVGQETHIAHGCRSSDGGGLSKLVRDGEFLLYSKN